MPRIPKHSSPLSANPIPYVRKWHAVRDGVGAFLSNVGPIRETSISPRALLLQARIPGCNDIDNEEKAYEYGESMEVVLDWLQAELPRRDDGGTRRCVLRLHTWEVDEESQLGFNPKWLSIGGGMTAHATIAKARRWARKYIESIDEGFVSRRVVVTAVEFVFWTAAYRTDYL